VTTRSPSHPPSILRWCLRCVSSTAVIGWMAVIFYLSSLSSEAVATLGLYDAPVFDRLGFFKSVAAHMAVYAALACLIQAAIWSWKTGVGATLGIAWTAAAAAGVYGLSDEFHQLFVIGRSVSWMDVGTNAAGAVAAAMAMRFTFKSISPMLRLGLAVPPGPRRSA